MNSTSRQLIKTSKLKIKYNPSPFSKKYEVGYLDTFQDIDNKTKQPVSFIYSIFRAIYKTNDYDKAREKIKSNIIGGLHESKN